MTKEEEKEQGGCPQCGGVLEIDFGDDGPEHAHCPNCNWDSAEDGGYPKTDLVSYQCPFKELCMATNANLAASGKWKTGDQRPMSCRRCNILGIRLGQVLKQEVAKEKWLCVDCRHLDAGSGYFNPVNGDAELPYAECMNCPDEHQAFWMCEAEEGYVISKCPNYEKRQVNPMDEEGGT